VTGYDFHPEARTDLDEIWDFIVADISTPLIE
jgi:RNAse (barnase) inhibitor barstar